MVLETVGQQLQATNPYISMPVKLEQYLMEGAYNKVVLTEKNLPSPYYMVFVKTMLDTVRKEIAQCVEKSFKRIAGPEAARMLLFTTADEAFEYGIKRGWTLTGDHFVFEDANVNSSHQPKTVETDRLAKQNVYYAKQLEMIV
uniref:CSN8/PSMD8/EIF3K domain-containing protein n=1 Tax=Plectus sambesii TaxID=2011161 RepID=A0A914XLB1_9BILA